MKKELCQYPTPAWVAQALIDRHFPQLDSSDCVLEPSCGPGAFLNALPAGVLGLGIDIDPTMVAIATADTGRQILTGDFLTYEFTFQPTAIIGNPPFRGSLIDAFLDRCHQLLPDGASAGFILPSYVFRTASRVSTWLNKWSLQQEMLPRSAFCYRMREPLVFAVFSKDIRRTLIGFALYDEETDRQKMKRAYRQLLAGQHGSAWRAVCKLALTRLGGHASLPQIYAELEDNRPTITEWWREKIRQTLRVYSDFEAVEVGIYKLSKAA